MNTFKPPSEAFITPLSKSGEGTVRKVQISLPKNIDDTHPKYWQTKLDSTLKEISHHDQVGFMPGCKGGSTYANQ